MKKSSNRLLITICIVLGLALAVLILSILGQENAKNINEGKVSTIPDVRNSAYLELTNRDCITVTVYGQGYVSYTPQFIVLDIVVKNPKPDINLEKIYNDVVNKGNDIVRLLLENGFEVEVKTIQISPTYQYPYKLQGYFVEYYIRAKISSNKTYIVSKIIPKLVSDMVTLKLYYMSGNIDKLYSKALKIAIEDALSKLKVLSNTLNMSKIDIVNIKEVGTYVPYIYTVYATVRTGTSPTIIPSKYFVNARVSVTARLCRG